MSRKKFNAARKSDHILHPGEKVSARPAESMRVLLHKLAMGLPDVGKRYDYPVKPVDLAPGVLPAGMAMDASPIAGGSEIWGYLNATFAGGGFPGYPYLSGLATRAEYRAFASAISTELTREWLEIVSTSGEDANSEKLDAIKDAYIKFNVRGLFQRMASDDVLFGRAQMFIDLKGADRKTPLILDPRTVKQGSLNRICSVEANWTTPSKYNAIDPVAPDFYKPSVWFMLGDEIHASRLLTVITRPMPDLLKAAFNFGGMSLSQLAEPYVDNWLRTRQSVADLINNFSITALQTSMDQVLTGGSGAADDLFARAQLFTDTRSNKGLMLLDKDREALVQLNTPLSGLSELQAQSLEHLCTASRIPAMILTGISPTGMNASSEGELRAWDNWISAQQEAFWREPLDVVLKVIQLHLFGAIDPSITFNFLPLYQQTPKEIAEINEIIGRSAVAYINAGVLDPQEERERLAPDPDSGYQGIDVEDMPEMPEAELKGGEFGQGEDPRQC